MANLGVLYAEQKENDKSEEILKQVPELDPSNNYAFVNLAVNFIELDDYSSAEALTTTEAALAIEPDSFSGYARNGDPVAAVKEYQEAMEIDPMRATTLQLNQKIKEFTE